VSRSRLKKIDPAIEAFERALPLTPEPAPVYFNLGLLYMEKNDLGKAMEAYRRGLALDPSDVAANQNYALLLMQGGEFREAVIPLERLKKIRPADVSTRATLIEAYLKGGMKSEGENEIEELLDSHLATLPEGLALAKLLLADRETDAALRILEYLRSSWPTSAEAHGELGLLLIDRKRFGDAAEELGRAVELDPDSARYSSGLGEALVRSGRFLAALKFLLGVQKKFGDQPNFQFELALAYLSVLRYPEAVSVLEKLARERPDSSSVQFYLGGSYMLSGDLKRAEESYRRAIQLRPQEPTYYRELASLLQKRDPAHLAEAKYLLEKAVALDPTDAESKIVLASCLEKEGKREEAAALLEQAVGSNPDSRRAHTALARLYRRQGKLAQAQQEQSIAARLEDQKMKGWSIWGPYVGGGP
jgi:tetratricopeptide (TPR) repeat protein